MAWIGLLVVLGYLGVSAYLLWNRPTAPTYRAPPPLEPWRRFREDHGPAFPEVVEVVAEVAPERRRYELGVVLDAELVPDHRLEAIRSVLLEVGERAGWPVAAVPPTVRFATREQVERSGAGAEFYFFR